MKLEPIGTPSPTQPAGAKSEIQAPMQTARERAMAKLLDSGHQESPVRDASRVSPEEMSVVMGKSSTTESVENGQADISRSTSESVESPKAESKGEDTDKPLSSEYAILARKEKSLRQREAALKAREAALKQPAAQEAPKTPSIDPSKVVDTERLKSDPFGVLNELGLTYDQLTEMAMNAPRPEQMAMMNEMRALKAEIAALKGETESTKKSFQQSQEQQRTQAIAQIRNEVNHLVKNSPDFETIRETNSTNDVVELIEKTFDEDGILLPYEEAARQVEEYLVEEAMKLAKLKKIQQRLQPKASAPAAVENKATENKEQLKTLTNSVASSRQLSARERALLAFQGKLNK